MIFVDFETLKIECSKRLGSLVIAEMEKSRLENCIFKRTHVHRRHITLICSELICSERSATREKADLFTTSLMIRAMYAYA